MSLDIAKLVRSGLNTAFNLAGQITVACTYKQPSTSGFTASTGVVSPTYATASVTALILDYSEKEIDGQKIKVGDQRVILKGEELGAIEPGQDDFLVEDVGGLVRQVVAFTTDPTGESVIFQMRRISSK